MYICWQDFETGGLDVNVHSPLSFAMVITKDNEIVHEWYTQIRQPPFNVTPEAMKVNKLNLEDKGLTFEQFTKEYLDRISKFGYRPMYAGHNCSFDRPWLKKILNGKDDLCHYHSIDTMVLGNSLKAMGIINPKALSLGMLAEFLGIKNDPSELHNALFDAKTSFYCFLKIRDFLKANYGGINGNSTTV